MIVAVFGFPFVGLFCFVFLLLLLLLLLGFIATYMRGINTLLAIPNGQLLSVQRASCLHFITRGTKMDEHDSAFLHHKSTNQPINQPRALSNSTLTLVGASFCAPRFPRWLTLS
jgi:hypothetical protein